MFGFLGGKKYRTISAREAERIMKRDPSVCVLDVRSYNEYNMGHIPGAVCIPVESIGREPIVRLADRDQMILVYCRSGRRAKKAAAKLARLGYTNVAEFGGIMKWKGPVKRG